MLHFALKHFRTAVCLSALMLTTVCGYSQCYRHAHIHPYAIDHSLMTIDAIARQAIFADLVLHDFSDDAVCSHHAPYNRSAMTKLYAEEIAINTAAPLAFDLLSLTDINDRDLRAAGFALGCAQLALSAAAINKAAKANKEAVEAESADTESTAADDSKLQEQRRKENKAITTLFFIEAAAMTLDAIFGNYGGGYRPHHYYHHRHHHPFY